MNYFGLGDKLDYPDLNAIVYLLRKFKRLTSELKLGSSMIESDYGNYSVSGGLTSVGGNFILEDDVTISSTNVLRNCFYTFNFSVIDVNLSGTVNKRIVSVTGDTGDNGVLEVVLEPSLLESDEVLLPEFNVDIVFDPHEYYTPVSVLDITLESDKRFVSSGEVATVTATVLDGTGEPLEGLTLQFNVNGMLYTRVTDENGQATWSYTGTGVSSRVEVIVSSESLTLYDSVMTATVTGRSVSLGANMIATEGNILIDWGDGTTTTRQSGNVFNSTHNYTDGQSEHTIGFIGEITSLGENCFIQCTGLTSITIPNTVTSLGRNCLAYCTGLTSVSIPSSVTSLGELCFYGCYALVDYQLYWKDTAIIEYNSNNMPVNSNTYFTIPQGQRTQYLSKHYPNKIKIRGYDLSVTTDKPVIESDETTTVTATLTYNMEPISNKTVSYTIRQGATIIDTGSDTTDSNGQIEIEYTGTSAGKITIQTTYDDLTETTVIYDSTIHLQANNTDKTILAYNTYATVTTNNNKIQITTDTTANATCAGIDWYDNTITYHDIGLNSLTDNTYNLLLKDFQTTNNNIWRVGIYVKQGGGWQLLKTSPYLTNGDNLFEFTVPNDATALWVRVQTKNASKVYECSMSDWVLYGVGDSGKVDTSISLSSDKNQYYTDESIILSGSLVDEDNQPLVNADVKVYRGTSLLETVSTDSTGAFGKSVSGLSAGSYSFKAVYDGDDTYQGSTSSTVSVIVQNHSYSLSIASDKQSILTSESVTISGQLLKDSGAYASQSIDLYDGVNKIATLTTGSDGEYEETVSGLSVGVHTFKAVNANAESSTISVTVSEPTHTYSLSIASDKQSILTTESVILSGQLLMDSSPYASQSISLYDGSTLVATLTTDSDGEYEETVSGLSVGTHTFKAVHTNVESSTVTVTVSEPTPVHDYSLSVVSDKDILSYADSESATITATLEDNGVAVSGETLNYVIKHGSTTITTGSDTTDSNGEISFTYSATGVGDVNIEISYGILLQETYEVQDCFYWNDNEIQITGTNKHTLYDSDLSVALPTNAEISFDVNTVTTSTSKDYRWWFMSKSLFRGMTYPSDSLYFDKKPSYILYNQRANGSDKYPAKQFTASTYATIKYVKNGTTVKVYVDDTLMFEDTVSWIENYSDYTISAMKWSGSETMKMKNVKFKALW